MTTPIATGSGLERLMACDGPAYLQHVESTSDDAERGRTIHAFLETASTEGRDAALALLPDDLRPALEALDLSKLPVDPKRYAAEVAFAYDPLTSTARELGRGLGRHYDVAETEIPGTADVTALLDDDGVFVADFKAGWSKRTPAKENPQLLFYALCSCRAYGRSRAVVQIIRVMEDGTTWTDEASLDAFDLDLFASRLLDLYSHAMEVRNQIASPRLAEGSQCRWCPCYATCPAKVTLLAKPFGADQITPEIAASAYERLRLYKAAVEKAEAILKDYARTHPIPLEGGEVYGVRIDRTRSLDGKVAEKALRDLLGDAADAAISVEVTQAGIKRALAKAETDLTLDAVLEEIRKRGGLTEKTAPKLVAHKPKEAA